MSARPSRTSSTAFTSAAWSQKAATNVRISPIRTPTQVRIAASSAASMATIRYVTNESVSRWRQWVL